ncbi:hypothetical protein N431DRAFT_475214 [Stipitochalara longipes BDJ]|nr:hypothetical protein N431DRAFT_475214 [Stipitochalara longipes BDJ]
MDHDDDEGQVFLIGLATPKFPPRRLSRLTLVVSSFIFLFFITSSLLFGIWFYNNYVLLNRQYRQTSSYSPLFDLVPPKTETRKMNGTFWPPKPLSIARRLDNESDRIWDDWAVPRAIPVTSAQIRLMGKDLSTAVILEDEDWGLGDDAYVAAPDLFH